MVHEGKLKLLGFNQVVNNKFSWSKKRLPMVQFRDTATLLTSWTSPRSPTATHGRRDLTDLTPRAAAAPGVEEGRDHINSQSQTVGPRTFKRGYTNGKSHLPNTMVGSKFPYGHSFDRKLMPARGWRGLGPEMACSFWGRNSRSQTVGPRTFNRSIPMVNHTSRTPWWGLNFPMGIPLTVS